ncbi:MAG: plasmid mobilization relaxosome protein MobC [Prolixibacteraceae bacterium]|nr:plasmid mobilization relaxosome protein MobC [Prolixibacteraceae bacterium]
MRPPTPEEKKLGEGIRVRLTNREKEQLTERCKKEGYSTLSDFGRAKLLRKREIRRIEASKEFSELMGQMDFELNKIGVNLNQIAKKLNTYLGYQLDSEDKRTLNNSYETLKKCFVLLQKYMDHIP